MQLKLWEYNIDNDDTIQKYYSKVQLFTSLII